MKESTWGIIGPGNIARQFVRDLQLIRSPQRVGAVLGHKQDSTDEFAKEFSVQGSFTDLHSFLDYRGIDAVYIASPHPQHYVQALACLERKIPVLCEKPLTLNAKQAEELVAASRLNNTFLMEGMWIRFLPSIQLALSLIKQGRIGNIINIKASICYKAPDNPDNRYFNPALGGGSLLDLGIYPVFLACLLLGKPGNIKAIAALTDEGVDETCSMLFQYDSGQHATLESSLLAQSDLPAEITGEKGTIKILDPWYEKSNGIELNVYDEGKIVYPCQWEGHGLYYEAQEMLHCLDQYQIESKMLPHSFSLSMMQVMDEIRSQINVTYDMYE
jgi:predicted dehydrogenase